ncbi:MAG: hypothetical protein RSD71_00940 [Flavobacterium sp.]|uniref:hypothetical protein n=1 Tax=Flavobacterium sp. TaxID=239 RepID=UPI002FCAAD75
MKLFKTQFNYLILVGRFILMLFFGTLSVFLMYLIIEKLKLQSYSNEVLQLVLFNFILMYLTYHFVVIICKQSYNFEIEESNIFKISIFSDKKELLKTDQIKGFSTSIYPIKVWNFKSIILYLKNGKKLELPQFLYFNFNEIENKLIENSVIKLGHEKYKWKFFDSRHYQYE